MKGYPERIVSGTILSPNSTLKHSGFCEFAQYSTFQELIHLKR